MCLVISDCRFIFAWLLLPAISVWLSKVFFHLGQNVVSDDRSLHCIGIFPQDNHVSFYLSWILQAHSWIHFYGISLGCSLFITNPATHSKSKVYLKKRTYWSKDHLLRNSEYYTGNNKHDGRCIEMYFIESMSRN